MQCHDPYTDFDYKILDIDFYIACFQYCNYWIRCLGFYKLNAASNAGKGTGCILCTWLLFRDDHNCCNTLSSGNIICWVYFQKILFLN